MLVGNIIVIRCAVLGCRGVRHASDVGLGVRIASDVVAVDLPRRVVVQVVRVPASVVVGPLRTRHLKERHLVLLPAHGTA